MKIDIKSVVEFILSQQNTDGSFSTYELYPVVHPDKDWSRLPDNSPFITANVMYSLLQANSEMTTASLKRAAKYLWQQRERDAYWRFWPARSAQHHIPTDIDDTCVVSFVLTKLGYNIDNRNVLMSNKNKDGYFETWLTPKLSNLVTQPVLTMQFAKDCFFSLPTRMAQFLTFHDAEPAVAANALLYLGEEGNEACVESINNQIFQNSMRLQYYYDELMVYYHVSRAYANGVKTLGHVRKVITERITNRFETITGNNNILLQLMAANVLLDFKTNVELAERLVLGVANDSNYPNQWKCLAYFSSENRNFMAGAPEFTAALYIEAASKLNIKQ